MAVLMLFVQSSLRICGMGSNEASDFWFTEIEPYLHNDETWDTIKERYQPRHNALMTEFRKYAKKEGA